MVNIRGEAGVLITEVFELLYILFAIIWLFWIIGAIIIKWRKEEDIFDAYPERLIMITVPLVIVCVINLLL